MLRPYLGSGVIGNSNPSGLPEYNSTADFPTPTGSGDLALLTPSQKVFRDSSFGAGEENSLWLPYNDLIDDDDGETLLTPSVATLGAMTLPFRLTPGSTQPLIANGYDLAAPDGCITTTDDQISVAGYQLATGTPPNSDKGYLLVVHPKQLPPAGSIYCQIYCSLLIGSDVLRLRCQIDQDGSLSLGNLTGPWVPWSKGNANMVANEPFFVRLKASTQQASYIHTASLNQSSHYFPLFGQDNATPGYVFGLACTDASFAATTNPMTYEHVTLLALN